ncbi:MAG TPA: class I SAM-dependent RNA methyltransferase [Firmicutes bacterium]|nr:class I SAM-dependent RNA methyltransferase [Bacillota bacterium]
MAKTYTVIATAAMGIEGIVAKELKALGYTNVIVENGRCKLQGTAKDIAILNLWLRTADRIKIEIGSFKAYTFDELFERTKKLPWSEYISENGQFPVQGKSVKSKLFSVSDCQAIVKKAIVESLRKTHRIQGELKENGPLYKIEVSLLKDMATLTLDTSGAGLHKRGYRVGQGEAPLKETLAAALVLLTNWRGNWPFADPFCGSGTIPIEAALIAQNIAPGFNRVFVSEEWPWIPKKIWDEVRAQADEKATYDKEIQVYGYDRDGRMIEIAKQNALEAGLSDLITFKQMRVEDFYEKRGYGTAVTNPPYGERLGERQEVKQLYQVLGQVFSQEALNTWSLYLLTSYENFEVCFGKKATKKRKLFNGFIRTDLYQYYGPKPKKQKGEMSE